MKTSLLTLLALALCVVPASAIAVATPTNGAQVSSPFLLVAGTDTCDSQPVAAMGYSIDYGATAIVPASFSSMVIAGNGLHTLHVKCWGTSGAADDTDLNLTVVSASQAGAVSTTNDIQTLQGWAWNWDPGSQGSANGSSSIVNSPSLSGAARKYSMSFTGSGGEIFHTTFGADPNATHFVYDAEIWITNPSAIANLELDMNQVMSNGNTVIYGVQCDGYTGTWDYTINSGTPASPVDTWVHSNAPCPAPRTWAANAWHHVQISYSRDSSGNVTYQTAVLDGVESDLVGATGNSAFSLGWASTLLTNFQLDGLGSRGSATAYVDNLTVYRW